MLPEFRIATHPGQILLAEFLEPLQLTQAELARTLHIPLNRINELVRGKRGLTPECALLLSEYFKNSHEFWMNLQTAHDLSRARQEMRKYARPGGITTLTNRKSPPASPRFRSLVQPLQSDLTSQLPHSAHTAIPASSAARVILAVQQ